MKKKIISLVLSFVLCFSVVCVVPSVSTVKTDAASAVKYVKYNKHYTFNGAIALTVKTNRAVLKSSSASAKKINKSLKRAMNRYMNKQWEIMKRDMNRTGVPGGSSLNIKITYKYNKNGKYSFLFKASGYLQGATTFCECYGYTYSKKTGKKINLLDTIKTSIRFRKKIVSAYRDKYGDFANVIGIKNRKLSEFKYYLKGKYIYVMTNDRPTISPVLYVRINYSKYAK